MPSLTPSRIVLRHSNVSGEKPSDSDLLLGEIFLNIPDNKLYYKNRDSFNQIIEVNLTTSYDLLHVRDVNLNSETGELIASYSDNTTKPLGNVIGPHGRGLAIDGVVDYVNQLPSETTNPPISNILNKNGTLFIVRLGEDSETPFNPVGPRIYSYITSEGGSWSELEGATVAAGVAGPRGNTILSGNADNPDEEIGIDGDYYLDTINYVLFGPKSDGSWPTIGVNLQGPIGASGGIESIVAGSNISIDYSDALNPVISASGSTSNTRVIKPSDYLNGAFVNGTYITGEPEGIAIVLSETYEVKTLELYNVGNGPNEISSVSLRPIFSGAGSDTDASIAMFNCFGFYDINIPFSSYAYSLQKITIDTSSINALYGVAFGSYNYARTSPVSNFEYPPNSGIIIKGNGGLELILSGHLKDFSFIYLNECLFKSIDVSSLESISSYVNISFNNINNLPNNIAIYNMIEDVEKFILKLDEFQVTGTINFGVLRARESVVGSAINNIVNRGGNVIISLI